MSSTNLVDYHNHTTLCGHATGTMTESVEKALERGLSEFGFSEHSHWMMLSPGEWLCMSEADLPRYVESVREMQRRYNREGAEPFHVRLGIEMDFVPTRLETARRVSERYDWDYRLGSVHHLGLWNFQRNWPEKFNVWDIYSIDDVYEVYFGLLRQMIEARFCDVISHLDVIKKMGRRPEKGTLPYIEPLIPLIAEAGMAVEINTSGKERGFGEFCPAWDIVERLIEARVPITLGSDSHAPDHVARYFDEAVAGLKERGCDRIVRFEKRRMIPVEI